MNLEEGKIEISGMNALLFSSNSSFIETTNRMMPAISAEFGKFSSTDNRVPSLRTPDLKHPIATKSLLYLFSIGFVLQVISSFLLFVEIALNGRSKSVQEGASQTSAIDDYIVDEGESEDIIQLATSMKFIDLISTPNSTIKKLFIRR